MMASGRIILYFISSYPPLSEGSRTFFVAIILTSLFTSSFYPVYSRSFIVSMIEPSTCFKSPKSLIAAVCMPV